MVPLRPFSPPVPGRRPAPLLPPCLCLRRGVAVIVAGLSLVVAPLATPAPLPRLDLPDPGIAEVYRGNWQNTLLPCRTPLTNRPPASPHVDADRPWRVDVNGHYPGWYPGVDMKHSAAAYLACEQNLPLVLRAWDHTVTRYLLADGAVRPMTMWNNPHAVVPESTVDGTTVFYPLRLTANIDALLLGDLIFRFSQDRAWLASQLPTLRRVAGFLEDWIDQEGLLHGDSYDLDQVYREIDGVAQASAGLAFRRLAALEAVAGTRAHRRHAEAVADRLIRAIERHFWDESAGYYLEHLVYNNVAAARHGARAEAGSTLDASHAPNLALDGIPGVGIDAFQVGTGAAGRHEWAAATRDQPAWFRVTLPRSTTINRAILYNRTSPEPDPGDRFAAGDLEFSDGSPRVHVTFNPRAISRAEVAFPSRTVEWVRFVGTRLDGRGRGTPGLAEFVLLPTDRPYLVRTHGMTDSSLAIVAFGLASAPRAARVWQQFQAHESKFYAVGDLHAPTWIASAAETYGPGDLNRRAPHKDCVAMGRTWRYDALLRHRMNDGDGLVRTLGYARQLYERPSGGGRGFFAERYGLGRFQPGDEAQATIPAYAEYPAVYNSTVVQEALLGLTMDAEGRLDIEPCVPDSWYRTGFRHEGCGVRAGYRLVVEYGAQRVEGSLLVTDPNVARPQDQRVRLRLPPELRDRESDLELRIDERRARHRRLGDTVEFKLPVRTGSPARFRLEALPR